jgi:hypothetical protein
MYNTLIILKFLESGNCCGFLDRNKVNQGLEEKDGKVRCLLFAPKAPGQNPLEDIWLQGKDFLRRHFHENKTFQQVKWSFFNFLNRKVFNFEKSNWYLEIPQPV